MRWRRSLRIINDERGWRFCVVWTSERKVLDQRWCTVRQHLAAHNSAKQAPHVMARSGLRILRSPSLSIVGAAYYEVQGLVPGKVW